MTGRDTRPPAHIWTRRHPGRGLTRPTRRCPQASVGGMSGLLEILVAHGGREDLPELAHELTFEVDDLLPLVDAAQVLGLAEVDDADLQITDDGRTFVAADILESKQIFARQARERAPLVRAICKALDGDQGRQSGRGVLPRPSAPGLLRGRGPAAAQDRHRLGPLRRALRLRRQHRPAHLGPPPHAATALRDRPST